MTPTQKRRLAELSADDRVLTREEIREWADLTLLGLSVADRRAVGELASWL